MLFLLQNKKNHPNRAKIDLSSLILYHRRCKNTWFRNNFFANNQEVICFHWKVISVSAINLNRAISMNLFVRSLKIAKRSHIPFGNTVIKKKRFKWMSNNEFMWSAVLGYFWRKCQTRPAAERQQTNSWPLTNTGRAAGDRESDDIPSLGHKQGPPRGVQQSQLCILPQSKVSSLLCASAHF